MAIVSASLTEEILSRQEKSVLRGIYRAGQLAEALVMLDKVTRAVSESGISSTVNKSSIPIADVTSLQNYLQQQIVNALVSTKAPVIPVKKDPSQPEKTSP